jgi:hypothetical protein
MRRSPAQNNGPLPMPRFAERLQDGERLLWEGRPDLRRYIQPKAVAVSLLTLAIVSGAMLFDWLGTGTMPFSSPVLWLSGLGAWMLCAWFGTSQIRAEAQTAAYALTNRRILFRRLERLTSKDWRLRVDEVSLQTVCPSLRNLGGGYGTINLGLPYSGYARMLQAIPDASAVYALLMDAQSALSLPQAEPAGPYYAKTSSPLPSAAAAWGLENTLRRGETVIWEGGMNAALLLRSEIWALVGLLIILSGMGGGFLYFWGWWTPLWQALITSSIIAIGYPFAVKDDARSAGNRRYALTNRRVLIINNITSSNPLVSERELPETAGMRLVRGRSGFGTIIFEKKTRFVWSGQSSTIETYEFAFGHVADAEVVFGKIKAAAKLLRGVGPEAN